MRRSLVILFIIGFILITFERVGVFRKFEDNLGSLTQPVQLSFYAASHSLTEQFSVLFDIGNLRSKTDNLAQKVALLEAENGRLKKLESENTLLRDQLGLVKEGSQKLIGAHVLGYTPTLTRGFVTVDKGSSQGVKKNQIVVVKDILLGTVSEVKENSSTVRLFSDPGSKVLGETAGGAKGIVIGDFGSRIKFTKILLGDKISTSDLVYSSGEDSTDWRIPKGLVIGKITQVNRLEAELFQEADLTPMIDISKLGTVFIREQ
jgi:rod shape-determining protein MreC